MSEARTLTGEGREPSAVATAPLYLRLIAYAADGLASSITVGMWVASAGMGIWRNSSMPLLFALLWTGALLFVWIRLAGRGQTVGKAMVGLCVVEALPQDSRSRLGIGRMFMRAVIRHVVLGTGFLLVLDLVLLLLDEDRHRSIADRFMASRVVLVQRATQA